MILIAFDPGDTTGAIAVDTETRKVLFQGEVASDAVGWNIQAWLQALNVNNSRIIVENFRERPGSPASINKDHTPLKIIGVIEQVASLCSLEVILQEPSVRIRMTDAVLVDAGFDLSIIKSRHVRDALRHLIYYWRKQDPEFHEELIKKEAARLC